MQEISGLSVSQMEKVAALRYHEGFSLVRGKLAEELERATADLEICPPEEILVKVAYWRAARKLVSELDSFLQQISDRVETDKELTGEFNYELDPAAMHLNQVREIMSKLHRLSAEKSREG